MSASVRSGDAAPAPSIAAAASTAPVREPARRSTLVLLGLLFAGVALAGVGIALQHTRDRRPERLHELELASHLVAAHVADRLRVRVVMAQLLARVAPPDGGAIETATAQRWLFDVQSRYGLAGLALLRADGTLVTGVGDAASLSDGALADAARVGATGEPMLHRLERRADGARPVAAWVDLIVPRGRSLLRHSMSGASSASSPVSATAHEPSAGLLLVRLAADQELQPLLSGAPLTSDAQLVLARRLTADDARSRGTAGGPAWLAITSLRDQPDAPLHAVLQGPAVRAATAGARRDERGDTLLAASAPVAGTSWTLEARVDARQAAAPLAPAARTTLQVTGLALAAIAALMVLAWRRPGSQRSAAAPRLRTPRTVQHDLQLLARHAPDAVLLIDEGERVVEANERAAQLFRRPRGGLIGCAAQPLLDEAPQATDAWRALWREMTQAEQLFEFEHVRADGTRVPLEIATRAIELEGHRFVRAAVRDVSQRRQQQADLRASEARFRAVAEAAPVGIFLGDLEGNRVYANARMAELTGWPQAPLGSPPRRDIFHPADRDRASAEFDASFAERRATRVEMRLLWPDGSVRWVVVQTEPERGPDGSVTGFVGTLTDVTTLRTMREEAERRARLLQTVFDSPFVCTAVVDADSGCVTMANQAMCELLGYSREELLHTNWLRALPADEQERAREPVHDMYSGRIDGYRARRRYLRRDGSAVRVLVDVRCLRLADGRVDSVVAVAVAES